MDLNTLWFILITVLFVGFFFLEGFDYGVGILLPYIAKDDTSRRLIINTIGPHWDGNEVWMLTAGGAMFAAFPNWYATLFSGFYLALFLMLAALIVRAAAFEYRSKREEASWRGRWDWLIFFGSVVPALLWGVALANIIHGLPIDNTMTYTGSFFTLLNPYSLVGGLASLSLFILYGAIFLNLKTTNELKEKSMAIAKKFWLPAVILVVVFALYSAAATGIYSNNISERYAAEKFIMYKGVTDMYSSVISIIAAVISVVAIVLTFFMLKAERAGWAFTFTALSIVFMTVMIFSGLFPNVMVADVAENSLTIYNASASPYTLKVMSIVAAIFVPIVLVYQGWTYWVFRQRLTKDTELEY